MTLNEQIEKLFRELLRRAEAAASVGESEFYCVQCGNVFRKAWSDAEAEREREREFKDFSPEEMCTVCDDCYRRLIPMAPS